MNGSVVRALVCGGALFALACQGEVVSLGQPDGGVTVEGGSGAYKTAITPGTVACVQDMPACEAPTIQCCFTRGPGGTGGTGGCAVATGLCTVQWELLCDGPEDCPSGMICSGDPQHDPSTLCAATPSVYQICHDHTQCPASAPNCCPVDMNETDGPQLGACDTRTVLTYGACDTP
jgi:hypothetical protein